MVTISEDFLNSLPADKRAEFLNATFEMLSMNPSDQDEIMAQNIRRLYEGHQGKVIKCSFCRNDEPDDQEFGRMYYQQFTVTTATIIFLFLTSLEFCCRLFITLYIQTVQDADLFSIVPRSARNATGSSIRLSVGSVISASKNLAGGWISSAIFTPLSFTS